MKVLLFAGAVVGLELMCGANAFLPVGMYNFVLRDVFGNFSSTIK
jgi:hypothetical protein